jgi:hypothetical protein
MLSVPISLSAHEWLSRILGPPDTYTPLYKRHRYLNHKNLREDLDPIFEALAEPEIPRGCVATLARRSGIPATTLRTWRKKLSKDRTWRPSREGYAFNHRIFTEEQEAILLDRIQARFLQRGLYYSDADFKVDALAFREELIAQHEALFEIDPTHTVPKIPEFACSPSFIKHFRRRHALSLRRPRPRKRPRVTEGEIQAFILRVQTLMAEFPPNRLVNIDETNWRTVAPGTLTWAEKGAESVHCYVQNDEKEGVTVIAGITAAGEKLPLTIIGRGKSTRCLAGFQLSPEVWSDRSESGWTTSEIMSRYLRQLRNVLFPEGPVVVILDAYAAHRTEATRETARGLGIELVFIPPGATDRLQPLDRRIFGVLKAHARRSWRSYYHATEGGKMTRPMIARALQDAWDRITPSTVESAWDIYDPSWGDDQSDQDDDDEEYRDSPDFERE